MVRGKHVVYFALQPPPEAAAEALARWESVRARRRLSAKPVPAARLHVSLNPIGEFKRLVTWPSGDPPPLVLSGDEGVIGVNALYSTIQRALRRRDMAPRREVEIVPHMTLAYDRAEVPETIVEPVTWTVTDFVLIHAVHGEGRYDVVGRIPLNG
jgi:2'-5' RNA ligase